MRILGVNGMRSLYKGLACLCLSLTVWSAIGLVVHHHSNQNEDSTCQVCVAAHATALTATSHTFNPVFRTVLTFRVAAVAVEQRLMAFGLHVRPPPSV
jgi:hypothetical protein